MKVFRDAIFWASACGISCEKPHLALLRPSKVHRVLV